MKTTKQHLMSWTMVAAGLAIALAVPQKAAAGDREWATAGKILTGVVAAHVLINAADRSFERDRVVVTERVITHRPIRPARHVVTRRDYRYDSCAPTVVIQRTSHGRGHAYGRYDTPRKDYRTRVGHDKYGGANVGAVVIEVNRYKRLYQPKVRGHVALVQERRYLSSPWVTVSEHPSIY